MIGSSAIHPSLPAAILTLCVLSCFLARSSEAFLSSNTGIAATAHHPSSRRAESACCRMHMLPNQDKLQGVIFDIDGTLADSWKLGFDATQSVLTQHGIEPISAEEYHRCTRYCTPDRLARHAGLAPGDDEFEAVGERLGAEFDQLYIGMLSLETAGFYPGIHELLTNLATTTAPSSHGGGGNLKLGALTNAAVAYAEAVFRVNLPTNKKDNDATTSSKSSIHFGSVHGADDVPAPKPAADGLWLVCKELGLKPEECVYVGDSPSDAMAAKNAGMPSIGVLWGSHGEESLRKAPFDHLCSSVEELMQVFLLPTTQAGTESQLEETRSPVGVAVAEE